MERSDFKRGVLGARRPPSFIINQSEGDRTDYGFSLHGRGRRDRKVGLLFFPASAPIPPEAE